MRTIHCLVLTALVVVLAAGSLGAQTAPPVPSSAPAIETPAALVPVLKAIREANTVAEAAAAFTGAGEENRRNVELNTAYMRRLLQLGQPQTAGIPATTLASIPVNDGMAFGVIGYNAGKQNDLPKALTSTMKAAGLLKDDPSIQNNLGQLVAWYEGDKKYKLPAADQESLDRLKTDLATQKPYMDGYQFIKDGYDKFAEANSANQQKVAAAEADVTAAQKKVADSQAQVKTLTDQQAKDVAQRNTLTQQPASGGRTGGAGRRAGGGAVAGGGNAAQIQQLNQSIADIQNKQLPQANKDAQAASAALTQKAQVRDKLKSAPLAAVPLAKLFNWLPPAVDGVVTMPEGAVAKTVPASAPSAAGT